MLATTLVALLTALFGITPVAAADGDNLRTFIADRSGTACASVDTAGNMSGHGFGGDVFALGVGVGFDGSNLLLSCYNDNTVTAVSPADGTQVAVHHITNVSQLGALAWDNVRGLLWACGDTVTIGTINLATNIFVPAFNPLGGCFDGLAYDGADDTLWSGFDANDRIDHSTTTGTHIATFFPGISRSGIAVGGDLLYLANNGGQQIYRAPKDLSSVTLFASFERRLEDLECDNITFGPAKAAIWSVDAYDNIVNAWEIPTGSCLFGGGAGQLTLTPATAENPVGSSHMVTAHLRDNNGPIANATILFSVSGANTTSGTGTTDVNGEATFTYTGTSPGNDTITACYDANNNASCDVDESTATATKVWAGAGPPAFLVLTPETATNTVDDRHCVTATVTDANGNPTPGITVQFSVSGSVNTSGSAVTDANGQATFCYTSALPGSDVITATASGGTNPTDTAAKTWLIPLNNEACKVTYGGRITAANGDKATFGGNAKGVGPAGQEEYQDHGPIQGMNVHSIDVLSVTCSADGTSVSIFGTATIDGADSFDYRIDVTDPAAAGIPDTYRIRLSNGYDSGVQNLSGGNVQIH